jgi:hypothetical protein
VPWIRLGQVYAPDGSKPWARSHAALPVPLGIGSDLFRFFISTRDANNRSHIGWVDVDLADQPKVIAEAKEPALVPGEFGSFDQDGTSIGSIVVTEHELRLYYMGWKLGTDVPWQNAIGLANARSPFAAFARYSSAPILGCSAEDPYTLSYPWVMRSGPNDWRMWYGSNLVLSASSADMQHVIKVASSRDGIHWQRDGRTVMGFASSDEYALARPSVTRVSNQFFMWFACRGDRYRIGCATSSDGERWTRCDDMGLVPSTSGWDSEMTCYPCVFWQRGKLWLAYNAGVYGSTGFGLALWEGELLGAYTA